MDREDFVQHVSTHRSDPLRSIAEWTDAINSLSRQWISDRQSLLEQLSKTETEAGKRWSLEKLDEVKRAFSKFICHCYEAMQNRRIQYMTQIAALEDNDPMRDLITFSAAKKGKNKRDRVPHHLLHAATRAALLEQLVEDSKAAENVRSWKGDHRSSGPTRAPNAACERQAASGSDSSLPYEIQSLRDTQKRLEEIAGHYQVPPSTFRDDALSWARLTRSWLDQPIAQRSNFGELMRKSLDEADRTTELTAGRAVQATRIFDMKKAHLHFAPKENLASRGQEGNDNPDGLDNDREIRAEAKAPYGGVTSMNEEIKSGQVSECVPSVPSNRKSSNKKKEGTRAKERRRREEWKAQLQPLNRPRRGSESGMDLPWKRTPAESEVIYRQLEGLGLLTGATNEEEQGSERATPERPVSAGGVVLPPLPREPTVIEGFYEAIDATPGEKTQLCDEDTLSEMSDEEEEKVLHWWGTRSGRSKSL